MQLGCKENVFTFNVWVLLQERIDCAANLSLVVVPSRRVNSSITTLVLGLISNAIGMNEAMRKGDKIWMFGLDDRAERYMGITSRA